MRFKQRCVRLTKTNFTFIPYTSTKTPMKTQTSKNVSTIAMLSDLAKSTTTVFLFSFWSSCPVDVAHISERNHFEECPFTLLNWVLSSPTSPKSYYKRVEKRRQVRCFFQLYLQQLVERFFNEAPLSHWAHRLTNKRCNFSWLRLKFKCHCVTATVL